MTHASVPPTCCHYVHREIAAEVNAQYELEGSERKAGNNLRITAQLTDAQTMPTCGLKNTRLHKEP
ncbi:MAG: hypothetical protein M3342_10835 [Bacteroidota bacterium]|nr:hypothetical protein [Bacteroidota bacterium]